jgi:transcriptional/translational regulatory protein YebC/TACO1
MNKAERTRLKELAVETIVASPVHSKKAQLAEALEKCVDDLEDRSDKCSTCSVCENHGDHEDESIAVDPDEVLEVHKALKQRLTELKDFHVKVGAYMIEGSGNIYKDLGDLIEALEEDVDTVEACALP